jgi:hypothetical protein
MMRGGAVVAWATIALLGGCAREGVEPPTLRVTRYVATWPCAAGDSGRHDLTLHEVEVSGEPTMYDLVMTCVPGDAPDAVVVERGGWGIVADSTVVGSAGILELYRGDGALLARYRRGGTDSLMPLETDGTARDIVLLRVLGEP